MLSIQHQHEPLPDQQFIFQTLALSPNIASVTSLRLNSYKSLSDSLELIKRTPNLLSLSLDEAHANAGAIVPHLVFLTPKLRLLHLGSVDYEALEPVHHLSELSQIILSKRVDVSELEAALKWLPAQLAVNIIFVGDGDTFPLQDSQSFLADALAQKKFDVARRLIELGAQVGKVGDPNLPFWRKAPLHQAIHAGNEEAVKLLLEAGASVLCVSVETNALQYALKHSPSAVVIKMLLENGLSNFKENYPAFLLPTGGSVYELAARSPKSEHALQLCLTSCHKVLDVNSRNFFQLPPIAYCESERHVDLLVEHGADPNLPVGDFETVLEAILCNPKCRDADAASAAKIAAAPKSRAVLKMDAATVDRIFLADSRRRDSWIGGATAPLLSFLFSVYPVDQLEGLLARLDYWTVLQKLWSPFSLAGTLETAFISSASPILMQLHRFRLRACRWTADSPDL